MNYFYAKTVGARFFALVTVMSLILSAFPAPFLIAEAATDQTIFADGFESGDTSAWSTADTKWSTVNNASGAHSGNVRVEGKGNTAGSALVKSIDVSAYENLTYSFWYQLDGDGFEPADSLTFDYTLDGSTWNTLELFADGDETTAWTQVTGVLPDVSSATNFGVRFHIIADTGSDVFELDDFRLAGDDVNTTPDCSSTDTVADTTFDTFTLGDVDGQNDWSSTGSFDQEVVANTYGYSSFGCQSLRISNAVTSGSFGDQTFAAPFADSVGEADATAGSFSEGTRYTHYEAEFDIASTKPTEQQSGLALSVSPDRGDGSRMSYLSFTDGAGGIDVTFYDTQGTTNPANFVPTSLGTLDRSLPHTIKFVMDMVDGANNDIVKIYIDGSLEHTGTSWENYYRYDSEASAEQSPRLLKTLLFRAAGTAAPATDGNGFLIDNLSLAASVLPVQKDEVSETVVVKQSDLITYGDLPGAALDEKSWFFYNDETDVIDNSIGSFVNGPDTAPVGDGSAEITVTGSERRNIATYQFSGTKLADITDMKFSTYNPSTGNGGSANRSAYINFNVDFTGGDTWQKRLAFVPNHNGTVMPDTWQEWDAIDGGDAEWWWSGYASNGNKWPDGNTTEYRSWDSLIAAFPNIAVRTTDSWFGFRVGEPYADGYTENIDAFVIGIEDETTITTTTYDFEPGEYDTTPPDVTVKDGALLCDAGGYYKVSFKLHDAGKVDKIVLNGVEKDLSNNVWSDLNNVQPGKFGAVEGINVLEVYDVSGNKTEFTFTLCGNPSSAPTATIKDGDEFTMTCTAGYDMVSYKLFDADKIDRVVINGVEKDLTDNKWSDVNFIKPGVFGAVVGENTMIVYDTLGNNATYTFFLCDQAQKTAAVSVCKYDTDKNPLAGWTLTLRGDHIEDLSVPATNSAGTDTVSILSAAKSYLADVIGTWLNDREPDNYVDAEYSTEDNWSSHMDGFTGYGADILDLQIDQSFVDWGDYNGGHAYTTMFSPAADGTSNFRVFDGTGSTPNESWYGDNSGSLDVSVSEGFTGITGENGCVDFEDVPFGTYQLDEVMQDGWYYVSGAGEVEVDEDTEIFTVVNTDVAPRDASLTITNPSTDGQTLEGEYTFTAEYVDDDNTEDPISWAIRAGTCAASTNTVAGNVDGYNDTATLVDEQFTAIVDMSTWDNGNYCFVVNPQESSGPDFRATRTFNLVNPEPPVCEIGVNVLGNPSFEEPVVTAAKGWDLLNPVAWIVKKVSDDTDTTMELQRTVNGWTHSDGEQHTELDGTEANIISQKIPTVAGETYTLSWDYSPRPGKPYEDNRLAILVDGVEVEHNQETGIGLTNTAWTSDSYTFTAGAQTEIAFKDDGKSDSFGPFLDNTSLECIPENPEPELYRIFGYVWNDEDEDGEFDEEEEPIFGRPVEITDGDETASTTSDIAGYYEFYVPAGTWTISETPSGGWEYTYPSDDHTHQVTVPGDITMAQEKTLLASVMHFFVPVAHAQVAGFGPFNFGNIPGTLSCDITASDTNVSRNQDFDLTWSTTGAASVTIVPLGAVATNGTITTSLTSDTTFELTATQGNDSVTCGVFVNVRTGGHSSGGSSDSSSSDGSTGTSPQGQVAGDSDTRDPVPQVLGDQTSVIPVGAPNAGAGGAAQSFMGTLLLAVALLWRKYALI